MAKYIDSLIHILKNINYNLDFSNANQGLNITEKSEIEKKISDYFLVLEDEYIKKGIIIIKKIEKLSL